MCGSNAWLAMLDRLVADGEFCEVVADHVWLDLDLHHQLIFSKCPLSRHRDPHTACCAASKLTEEPLLQATARLESNLILYRHSC